MRNVKRPLDLSGFGPPTSLRSLSTNLKVTQEDSADTKLRYSESEEEYNVRLEESFYGVEDDVNQTSFLTAYENSTDEINKQKKSFAAISGHLTDQDEWESQLLSRSGVEKRQKFQFADEEETSNQTDKIIVRNNLPKFLGKNSDFAFNLRYLKENISVVKDTQSDIARSALKGSETLNRLREERVKNSFRQRYWEVGGTKIGNAIGLKKKEDFVEPISPEVAKLASTYSANIDSLEAEEDLEYRKLIRETRNKLPIFSVREELLRLIRTEQVIIIVGETGSGKTTQLTQYLYEQGYAKNNKVIGCTQPRRAAAMSVAKRVSEEVGTTLGDLVGYSIRFEDKTSSNTRIKYMTDGILLRETLADSLLDKYSVVIMDEAHERSLNTDVLFGILKKILTKRYDFKLIVTSATLNAEKFSDYFGGCAKFYIPGRTFPVESYFSRSTCVDYVEAAVRKIIDIHLQNMGVQGDILVFMTGQEDITAVCELVSQRILKVSGANSENFPALLLLPMYSQLPTDLQAKIFLKAKANQRKCIVSTNIAETSLTVDGIKFVIDSGFTKISIFNPRVGMDVLTLVPISQANANQRAGRAGRTSNGYCWRLFTEFQYTNEFLETQVPEIQRTNLGNVVLLLKSLGVKDISEFEWMDAPPKENLLNSMYQLWVLGALDNHGDLTEIGKQMSSYPLDPLLSRMLIEASKLGCEQEMATVVSMLSVPEIFFRPPGRAEESDKMREKFFAPESDHLTLLNTFNNCKKKSFSKSYCEEHFIHHKAIIRADEIRGQICDEILKSHRRSEISSGDSLSTCGNKWDLVREALCSAYLLQVGRMKGVLQYVNLLSGIPARLHPSSALCGMGQTPEYVVYHELVLTSKEYMRAVTAVEPKWLAKVGPMFYSLKNEVSNLQGSSSISEALTDSEVVVPVSIEHHVNSDDASSTSSGSDIENALQKKLLERQRRSKMHTN